MKAKDYQRVCDRCGKIYRGTKFSHICPACRVEYGGPTGYSVCPEWLKRTYRAAVKYKCQVCGKHEKEVGTLIPHRIRRGVSFGKYTTFPLNHPKNNVKIVCLGCHKKLHSGEFT